MVHEPLTDGTAGVRARDTGSPRSRRRSASRPRCIPWPPRLREFSTTGPRSTASGRWRRRCSRAGLWSLSLPCSAALFCLRLGNDGVDGDGGLARRTVTDDEFALAAADRDHRVDGHDAGLHRQATDFRVMMPGAIFPRDRASPRSRPCRPPVHQRVDDAAEQALADRHGEQAARGLHFVARLDLSAAEQHAADFGFFEVQREADRGRRGNRSSR